MNALLWLWCVQITTCQQQKINNMPYLILVFYYYYSVQIYPISSANGWFACMYVRTEGIINQKWFLSISFWLLHVLYSIQGGPLNFSSLIIRLCLEISKAFNQQTLLLLPIFQDEYHETGESKETHCILYIVRYLVAF